MISKAKIYRSDHQFIYDYENLLYPVSAAIIGGITFGIWGGVAGFACGSIDQLAINYKIYDHPYLTAGIIGLTIAAPLSKLGMPYYIVEMIGFGGGLLFPTGVFYNHIDEIMVLTSGLLTGYSYEKFYEFENPHYGVALGFSLSVIDLSLAFFNISQNNYFTSALKDVVMVNVLLPIPFKVIKIIFPNFLSEYVVTKQQNIIFSAITHTSGILYAYSLPKSKKDNYKIIKLNDQIFGLYNNIIPEDELNDLITKQKTVLVSAQLMILKLTLSLAKHKNTIYVSIKHVGAAEGWATFSNNYIKILLFLFSLCSWLYFSKFYK